MKKLILIVSFLISAAALGAVNVTDAEITRRVQEQIYADSSLSKNARSARVITLDGTVLIKGVVQNPEEVISLLNKAQSVAGVIEIVNEIRVIQNY